jgi:hypothetical protein
LRAQPLVLGFEVLTAGSGARSGRQQQRSSGNNDRAAVPAATRGTDGWPTVNDGRS